MGITPQRLRERQKLLQQQQRRQQQQQQQSNITTIDNIGNEATATTVERTKAKAKPKSKSKQLGEAIDEQFFCIACCESKQQPYPFAW